MPRRRARLTLDQRAALPIAADSPNLEFLRLNRQQICCSEITAAIRLFIIDEDPIPAHLLASAATEIMVALSGGKQGVGLNHVHDAMKENSVRSDLQDELFQSLQHPYNFLKHSSSDLSVINSFSVDYIAMTIYTAIQSYKILFGELQPEMSVFYSMVIAWRTQWWEGAPGHEARQKVAKELPLTGASREQFCKFGRRMLRKTRDRAFP